MRLFWRYKIDHVLFWTATVLFYGFVSAGLIQSAGVVYFITEIFIRNSLLAAICYLNIYFFFPRFFKPGKYALYIVSVLGLLAGYAFFKNAYDTYLYGIVLNDADKRNFFSNTYYNFSIAIFYLIFSLTLDLSRRWYRQQLQLQQIQMEKLSTELNYLKAQINPHFLFNSINSIFFQIDKSNHKARESLRIFSDMLRYQLYECGDNLIPIEKEIAYLESYVALQRMRKNENDSISFRANTGTEYFEIPPLLIIPFVENAFKHGTASNGESAFIDISLSRQNGSMLLHVENSVHAVSPSGRSGGIGLKNVKRRLELLYEHRHQLSVENRNGIFTIDLKIDL